MSKKILLVGCGQLGTRHLQSMASMEEVAEIQVVDINSSSFELGKLRLKEMADLNPKIQINWTVDLNKISSSWDLCVVATQAKGRSELIKRIASSGRVTNFLIEKIVTQSLEEYEDLLRFADNLRLSIWVNCKTRTYQIHKYIKSRLDVEQPILFYVIGGNHGLANNGIHEADLFVYYDEAREILPLGKRIDPFLHPSRRGPDVYDLSGTLCGYTSKGSILMLSFAPHSGSPDQISIVGSQSRFIIDHFQKFAYESYAKEDWRWKKITIGEDWMVSTMTKAFVRDILQKRGCELPNLQECFVAHKFILNELNDDFNRLLNTNNNCCPVT